MALHIEANVGGHTHVANWHVGEPVPDFIHDARVVKFQADGDELVAFIDAMSPLDERLLEAPTIEGTLGGKMRILIADDDEDNRTMLTDLLEGEGHTVVACHDGATASRTYTEEGPFDMVVTDYQMPYKNGVVLIMDIRAANPDQKVILVSGDPPTLPEHVKKQTGTFPILQKPYRSSALLELIK
jgi:CheY-like chemotaxis protein